VQENNSSKLNTYLLNFVPKDPNKEFGKDGIWTGKLYEWNLTGDTILVQDIAKSKLNEKFAFKALGEDTINSLGSTSGINGPILSLKDRQTSSIFGWLVNLVENIVGAIGSLFGISEHRERWNEDGYWEGWRISFEGSINNDGGGGGGGGGSYAGAGDGVYYWSLPGYTPPGYYVPDGGIPDAPYPHGPNPNNNPPVYSSSLSYLINTLDLTVDEINFLHAQETNNSNNSIAVALENYLLTNGSTPENIEFTDWAVEYLNDNRSYTWNNFSDRFINNTAQYKIDSYIRNKYPKFSSIADGLVFFLGSNPKVVAALTKYSGFSKNKIMELATNGSGPNIKLSSENWTIIANGMFNAKISDNTIFLNEDNVSMFENRFSDYNAKNSLAFSLMVTILHETVHYGRFVKGMPDPDSTHDFGTKFEELGFGFNVDFRINQPVIYKMYFLP
jgi:hypothetical protein